MVNAMIPRLSEDNDTHQVQFLDVNNTLIDRQSSKNAKYTKVSQEKRENGESGCESSTICKTSNRKKERK